MAYVHQSVPSPWGELGLKNDSMEIKYIEQDVVWEHVDRSATLA